MLFVRQIERRMNLIKVISKERYLKQKIKRREEKKRRSRKNA